MMVKIIILLRWWWKYVVHYKLQ